MTVQNIVVVSSICNPPTPIFIFHSTDKGISYIDSQTGHGIRPRTEETSPRTRIWEQIIHTDIRVKSNNAGVRWEILISHLDES